MKKADRIDEFIRSMALEEDPSKHPCYLAYFSCFNAGGYYEAHDVLEHLWLKGRDENYAFFKGLIQLAGAFVHLKKQFERPTHPTDGRRLHPAMRLFRMALKNLEPYPNPYMGLDLDQVREIACAMIARIEGNQFTINPWTPESRPQLVL
jgi:predicted metal-dependent hydrolase